MTRAPDFRALAAEAMGTALLVATVIGSGIMAERLSGGSVALALLASTLATGAILVVLITTLGPLSGAQFNPVVSLVMAIRRSLPWGGLAPYILAQIAGGAAGAVLANLMFDLAPVTLSDTLRDGTGHLVSEAVATFALIGAILGGLAFAPQAISWLVGLTITAACWFTASIAFANPAVTLARTLSDSFAGIAPASVAGFLAAQLAGALIGASLRGWLLAKPRT